MEILIEFAVLALFICVIGFFNEKVTKFPYEIALLLYSSIIGLLLVIGLYSISNMTRIHDLIDKIEGYDMQAFLVEGVLCFMLFPGSCHHKMKDIKNSLRHITVLAFVCTLLGALFYAGLFYGGTKLLGINLSIPVCLMLGSIIAPSDPIAATGILKKFGLPKKISFLVETEALFNDGVGVALFVCFFSSSAKRRLISAVLSFWAFPWLGSVLSETFVLSVSFCSTSLRRSERISSFVVG